MRGVLQISSLLRWDYKSKGEKQEILEERGRIRF